MLKDQISQANGRNTTGKIKVLIPTGLPRNLDVVAISVESYAWLGHSRINTICRNVPRGRLGAAVESLPSSLDVSRESMNPNAHLAYGNIGTGANTRVRSHTQIYVFIAGETVEMLVSEWVSESVGELMIGSIDFYYYFTRTRKKPYVLRIDRLCGLVVRVPGYIFRGPGFDSGATTFSEK
jgi:hypothetical protein